MTTRSRSTRPGQGLRLARLLALLGAALLLVSLFLTWSHQFSPAFLDRWGASGALRGVPHDPTGWEVYSVADVVLALLGGVSVPAVWPGSRVGVAWAGVGAVVALAFVLHALAVPPTDGANIFDSSLSVPAYVPSSPAAGPGETVAIAGLGLSLLGVFLAAPTGRRSPRAPANGKPEPSVAAGRYRRRLTWSVSRRPGGEPDQSSSTAPR